LHQFTEIGAVGVDLSFDLSIFDLFKGVLGAGGTVVLPQPGSREDPALWVERVAKYGVTVWNSVHSSPTWRSVQPERRRPRRLPACA
jgi:non-ribosomal peptide synthetase component F